MKKHLLFLFLVLISEISWAQDLFTVNGVVLDSSTNETIPAALIKVKGHKNIMTNDEGLFSLRVPAGYIEINVIATGYQVHTLNFKVEDNVLVKINLRPESSTLETVVVSVGKYEQKIEEVTVSTNVIKSQLIENKNTVNCESIMEQVPGLTVQDGQVSMRGGSGFAYGAGSRVLLVVDDMPMLSGDAGDIKWNALPVENIEQIEVLKGASSVLYGSGALNGVIHVRTAYPREKPQTKINVTQGFYGNPQRDSLRWWNKSDNPMFQGVYFMHSRQVKQLDVVVGGAYFNDGGYREGEEEHRSRANFALRYRPKKNPRLNFGLNGNFQRAKGGLFIIWEDQNYAYSPSGGASPDSAGSTLSRFNNDRFNIDPYITYYTKKGNKHSLRLRSFSTINRNSTDTINQNSNANILYGDYQFQYKLKDKWHMVSGLSGFVNTIDSYMYGNHNGTNLAAYTQVDRKFFDRLNVSLGIRLESYTLDGTENISTYQRIKNGDTTSLPFQPVFRAGLNYRLTKSTFLRGSFGQGYRFPSVAEKYVTTSVGSLKLFSNPNLKPEYGWSSEIGIKQVLKIGQWKGYFDVAGFYTRYENMTEFTWGLYAPPGTPLNLNPGSPNNISNFMGFRAENAEEAQVSGFEIELAGGGKINKVEIFTLLGYTYMNPITLNSDSTYRATFSDSGTNVLKYRFKHLIKGDVQIDYKKISFGISVRYNSRMENVDKTFYNLQIPIVGTTAFLNLGDQLLPGFPSYRARFKGDALVFDMRLMLKITNTTRLGIIANNVFNQEYMGRPGDIQAPRNLAVQFSFNF